MTSLGLNHMKRFWLQVIEMHPVLNSHCVIALEHYGTAVWGDLLPGISIQIQSWLRSEQHGIKQES